MIRLEYEAYPRLVLTRWRRSFAASKATSPTAGWPSSTAPGPGVGDAAVVIAASAPHRAEAFEACRRAIEELKREVPIWKKEVSPSGEEWLGMRP